MDDYTRQKLTRLLRIISLEELQHRALLAKTDDERRIWHELYILKMQQRAVKQQYSARPPPEYNSVQSGLVSARTEAGTAGGALARPLPHTTAEWRREPCPLSFKRWGPQKGRPPFGCLPTGASAVPASVPPLVSQPSLQTPLLWPR